MRGGGGEEERKEVCFFGRGREEREGSVFCFVLSPHQARGGRVGSTRGRGRHTHTHTHTQPRAWARSPLSCLRGLRAGRSRPPCAVLHPPSRMRSPSPLWRARPAPRPKGGGGGSWSAGTDPDPDGRAAAAGRDVCLCVYSMRALPCTPSLGRGPGSRPSLPAPSLSLSSEWCEHFPRSHFLRPRSLFFSALLPSLPPHAGPHPRRRPPSGRVRRGVRRPGAADGHPAGPAVRLRVR